MTDVNPNSLEMEAHENKKMSKVKNITHLWERQKVEELLDGVVLAVSESTPRPEDVKNTSPSEQISNAPSAETKASSPDLPPDIRVCDKMFCVACSVEFLDRDDQKQHFKSDWHRFNIKLRIKNECCVSESKFEEITRTGDLSSISGSDSPSEDEDVESTLPSKVIVDDDEDLGGGHVEGIGKRHPRVFMRNRQGELLSVYRCVVHGKKNQAESPEELLSMVQSLPSESVWCILMLAGGHFAGAVFDGNNVVEHKTFHRYVVRAKRGTVQSVRDNKGHGPKSGGASIRRYNEAALATEIQELLKSWQEHLKSCHRIFLRVPTYNKAILFGGKTPIFDKKDPRIRLVPFQTRRPTYKELQRVQDLLSSVECYGMESSLGDHISLSPRKTSTPVPEKTDKQSIPTVLPSEGQKTTMEETPDTIGLTTKQTEDLLSSDEEVELYTGTLTSMTSDLRESEATKRPRRKKKRKEKMKADSYDQLESLDPELSTLRNELYTTCKTNDVDKLKTLLQNFSIGEKQPQTDQDSNQVVSGDADPSGSVSVITRSGSDDVPIEEPVVAQKVKSNHLLNCPFGENSNTLLHVASMAGHRDILPLLMEAGADPTLKDQKGQVPYLVANNKDTRNEFRRFMARFPDMYDYTKAQVPAPLSEEMERERKAKESERRKAMKKAKKERLKDQREIEAKEREETREKQRFLALSDREKRALAAEKRLSSQITSQGQPAPVLSRCFQCGADITGKVPFEYQEYKFCAPKCLKDHRLQKKQQKPS